MACVFWPLERAEKGIAFAKAHPELVIPYIQIPLDSPTVLEDIKRLTLWIQRIGEIPSGSLFNMMISVMTRYGDF